MTQRGKVIEARQRCHHHGGVRCQGTYGQCRLRHTLPPLYVSLLGQSVVLVEHGSETNPVEHGNKVDLIEQRNKADLIERGNKVDLIEHGNKVDLIELGC